MHQLAIIIAAATPTEILIDRLKESITEWEIHRDDDRLKEVAFHCHLITLKQMTHGKIEGAMKIMGEVEKLDQYRKMFSGNES